MDELDPLQGLDLASLQLGLAMVDLVTRQRRKTSGDLFELLLIKKDDIKLKMYQEKGHARPHFHVDYGPYNHVASYAVDTGLRLDGTLDRKYDKAVASWVERNRELLLKVWGAIQAGNPEQSFIASLSALE